MDTLEELRSEIHRSIATLRSRHASTPDPAERKAIKASITALNRRLSELNQAKLLQAAATLTKASSNLEAALAAARTGPFDGYLAALEQHFANLERLSAALIQSEALPPAPDDGQEAMSAARRTRSAAAAPMPRGLEPPLPSKSYADLEEEYRIWYDACRVRPEHRGTVTWYVNRLNRGRALYEEVGSALNGIPWAFIGVIHGMECGFNFAGHLHNGDPLTARTVQVPKGRPRDGQPPFTWRESAIDALTMKGFHEVRDWSIPHMLYLLEKYNGWGYRMRRLPSPYLWSFSNLYTKGKFVRDGVYDPNAVSKQCGAAVMLKAVLG